MAREHSTSLPGSESAFGGSAALAATAGDNAELDVLMDRYAEGDDAAFAQLHRLAAPRLRGFLLRLCGRMSVADDLLQETFLRIHRARGNFARGAKFLPWAYAIARNTFIDNTRRQRDKSHASIDDLTDHTQPAGPPGTAPDDAFSAGETLDIVKRTLASLPVSHREAFVLLRFEGLSVSEAAQILDVTEANVKIRAFRAYEAFRLALKKGEGDSP